MEPTLDSCGYLSVVADNFGKITLKVFDSNGRVARKICSEIIAGFQKLDFNINDLTTGTYILNAFNGDMFIKSFKFTRP